MVLKLTSEEAERPSVVALPDSPEEAQEILPKDLQHICFPPAAPKQRFAQQANSFQGYVHGGGGSVSGLQTPSAIIRA